MKSEKILLIAAAFALLAGSAAAQSELSAAYDAARAAAAAKPAPSAKPAASPATAASSKPTTCDEAKELETALEITLTPAMGYPVSETRYEYVGCDWAPRNDYLPPYTTRSYLAQNGVGLTVVTDEGSALSVVLLSEGTKWTSRVGVPSKNMLVGNEALASGDPVSAAVVDAADGRIGRGSAVIRNAAKPMYPQLKACETADWSRAAASAPTRANGKPAVGWDGRGITSLVLLTKTAAYYYHEDCDICAEVTRCELSNGLLSSAAVAHSVDCGDLKKQRSESGVVYDACTVGAH
jgi:hypothetical protein